MTNPKGYRRGTRDMFSRAYKKKGVEHLSTYLRTYKIGDIVDIKVRLTFNFTYKEAIPSNAEIQAFQRLKVTCVNKCQRDAEYKINLFIVFSEMPTLKYQKVPNFKKLSLLLILH